MTPWRCPFCEWLHWTPWHSADILFVSGYIELYDSFTTSFLWVATLYSMTLWWRLFCVWLRSTIWHPWDVLFVSGYIGLYDTLATSFLWVATLSSMTLRRRPFCEWLHWTLWHLRKFIWLYRQVLHWTLFFSSLVSLHPFPTENGALWALCCSRIVFHNGQR